MLGGGGDSGPSEAPGESTGGPLAAGPKVTRVAGQDGFSFAVPSRPPGLAAVPRVLRLARPAGSPRFLL